MSGLGFTITCSTLLQVGTHVLTRKGVPIWMGRLGAPIEDVDCDGVTVHPQDYERILRALQQDEKR